MASGGDGRGRRGPSRRGDGARARGLTAAAALLVAFSALGFVGCASVVRAVGPAVAPQALFAVRCREPVVALTIDDGPVAGSTERILSVLRERDVHATFFVIGERAASAPTLVEAIVAGGHELGNHTWQERRTTSLPDAQARESIARTQALLDDFGEVVWLRPGTAFYDGAILSEADALGLRIALADTFPYDTLVPSSAFHGWYIRHAVRPGSIIVLHDAHGRGERAATTLWNVLPPLQAAGYQVVSLSELVAHPACSTAQSAPPS